MAERGARLLVADDNKVNRLLLGRTLELQGHQVASASDGRQALAMLKGGAFDLLLLDLEMPELDGFAVLELLAGDAELRDQLKDLVKRFATSAVAQDLQQGGFVLGSGRRLQATVMFSDIRAFTAMVESQPPEETIELLNTYYTLMFDAISSHGGVVNQMIGDGLMAIFGAPLPLPEAPLAAVRAALDMAEMIELLNAERSAAGKGPLAIGIGIASGEVIAGYTGTPQRATYTCVGDTVNLAARLEAHTKVAGHGILIDGDTQAALAGRLATEALGPVQLKGKAAAVQAFAIAAS